MPSHTLSLLDPNADVTSGRICSTPRLVQGLGQSQLLEGTGLSGAWPAAPARDAKDRVSPSHGPVSSDQRRPLSSPVWEIRLPPALGALVLWLHFADGPLCYWSPGCGYPGGGAGTGSQQSICTLLPAWGPSVTPPTAPPGAWRVGGRCPGGSEVHQIGRRLVVQVPLAARQHPHPPPRPAHWLQHVRGDERPSCPVSPSRVLAGKAGKMLDFPAT